MKLYFSFAALLAGPLSELVISKTTVHPTSPLSVNDRLAALKEMKRCPTHPWNLSMIRLDECKRIEMDFEACSRFVTASYIKKGGTLKADSNEYLILYSLFKQKDEGDCPASKNPPITEIKRFFKARAWKRVKGLTPFDAKVRYLNLVYYKDPQWYRSIDYKPTARLDDLALVGVTKAA